jgi:hypothetical protein
METLVVIICLLMISLISAIAVFHPAFNDTLIQRIALSVVSVEALALAWSTPSHPLPLSIELVVVAAAAYAVECGRITKRNWDHRDPKLDRRSHGTNSTS